MPVFECEGIRFHYEIMGTGPAVVFCHGLLADSAAIKKLLGEPDGYSRVVWDCRGHGQTEPLGPTEAMSFDHFAADLYALLAHLDVDNIVVGGVSMGAGVATRFALDYPSMVNGLVLVRPAWLDHPSPKPLRPLELVGEYLGQFGAEEGRQRFETLPILDAIREVDPVTASSIVERFMEPRAWERRARLDRLPKSCPIRDWNEVKRLTIPALVIGCKSDYVHPLKYAKEWARRLPRADFVEAPSNRCGESQYSAAVQSALVSFLRTTEAELPRFRACDAAPSDAIQIQANSELFAIHKHPNVAGEKQVNGVVSAPRR